MKNVTLNSFQGLAGGKIPEQDSVEKVKYFFNFAGGNMYL